MPDEDQALLALQKQIRDDVEQYAAENGFALNPDPDIAGMVIRGLAKRQLKFGKPYCPCRVMSEDPTEDDRIVCPCEFHREEVERDGICHCRLLVRKNTAQSDS